MMGYDLHSAPRGMTRQDLPRGMTMSDRVSDQHFHHVELPYKRVSGPQFDADFNIWGVWRPGTQNIYSDLVELNPEVCESRA